jgi:hypothetical protein
MSFAKWLDTFVEEKGIDTEKLLEVEGPSGLNLIPVGVVIEGMKATTTAQQDAIRTKIVLIDFRNGDVLDFFQHLAKAIAI